MDWTQLSAGELNFIADNTLKNIHASLDRVEQDKMFLNEIENALEQREALDAYGK